MESLPAQDITLSWVSVAKLGVIYHFSTLACTMKLDSDLLVRAWNHKWSSSYVKW